MILQQDMLVIRRSDRDVHHAPVPEISDSYAATIQHEVSIRGVAHLAKSSVAITQQITIAFPTMPGSRAEMRRIEVDPGLVNSRVSHDVVKKLQFEVRVFVVINPAIRGVEILPTIVVEIGKRGAPEPTGRICVSGFGRVLESAVAVVSQQSISGRALLKDVDQVGA